MSRILLMSFLVLAVSLFAQFNDPIEISEGLGTVYYRGTEACEIVGNEVFLTFVSYCPNSLYFSHSINGINFINTIIDEDIYCNSKALPTLEVLPDGKIIIFYIKETDFVLNLYTATSIDNGSTFEIESIASMVSEFSSCLDGNELYISYIVGGIVNFSSFNYFTNTEESENADGGFLSSFVKFWGPDVLQGPVHSNSDIWIQQAGGGNNNGWPTFHGPVTTTGRVRLPSGGLASGCAPIAEIFRGGLEEQVSPTALPSEAEDLRINGIQVGVGYDIVYVKMNGASCQIMLGEITEPETHEFDVYSWFPHNPNIVSDVINIGGNWYEDSDLIYQNQVDVTDTIWVTGPSYNLFGNSFWVEDAELWIEGEVWGDVIWGCANNVYITSDITYTCTPVGDFPDGFSGYGTNGQPLYEDPVNLTDYFGLVSEKKIFLKYKHKDPFNNMQLRVDNCDDVNLYGAYAAIGMGDTSIYGVMACHHDGIFTFEYQHPHGSTPNFVAPSPYTLNDTIYTYIDFHKFIFPINTLVAPEITGFNLHSNYPQTVGTSGFPYESPEYINSYPNNIPDNYVFPYGTDYPWYNPVWPESSDDIVFDRGDLKLWGSLIQRRRGFMHRSGSDPYNHPGDNEWDQENYHFGGDHADTGYTKTYYYDIRFQDFQLNNFPTSVSGNFDPTLVIARSVDGGNNFETLNSVALEDFEPLYSIVAEDNLIAAITRDSYPLRLQLSTDHGISFSEHIVQMPVGKFKIVDAKNGMLYFYYHCPSNEDKIIQFDPATLDTLTYQTFDPPQYLSNFGVSHNNEMVRASFYYFNAPTNILDIEFNYSVNQGATLDQTYHWQSNWEEYIYFDYSTLYLNFDQQDFVYASIFNSSYGEVGDLWLAKGSLPDLTGTEQFEIPNSSFQISNLSNYPNPFNPSTTISFNLNNESAFANSFGQTGENEKTELVIYNLKGQKVKSFSVILSEVEGSNNNQYSVIWDGTDDSGKSVSSGIYFYKLKSGDFEKTKKMLLMK